MAFRLLRSPSPLFIRRQMQSLCGTGVILGTLLFAASLTPSLVPRGYLMQGALAGASFAIGYGIGVFCRWLWHYLELPDPPPWLRSITNALLAAASLTIVAIFLWQSAAWQNAVRAALGMKPVGTARPFEVCAIALLTFVVLLALARLFRLISRFTARHIRRIVPRRIGNVIGVVIAALLFWSIGNDVVIGAVFRSLDSSYGRFDALLEPDRVQPTDPNSTGGAASLVEWTELGRAGREFVATGPTALEISAITGRPAQQPIRVYVGLRSADTPEARAKLALEELKRQGGFNRSILVVITPTGTGWVDPSGMDPVEYLHNGDVASVAVQYSYLSSPLSLLAQPEYGAASASALFREIYNYWTSLPKDHRPKLYLFGLSLGALNSEQSVEPFETIGDPIDGALWSGPPFASPMWSSITRNRNPGSRAWLPEFRDGRLVRFINQDGSPVPADAPWGPMRIVYLQYASDAIVFFDYRDAYRRPDWMQAPRGPDVSSSLHWYPIVTMLQLVADMLVATNTPMGYGHVYAPEHYTDAWLAVTNVHDWSSDAIRRLKQHLGDAARSGEAHSSGIDPYGERGG